VLKWFVFPTNLLNNLGAVSVEHKYERFLLRINRFGQTLAVVQEIAVPYAVLLIIEVKTQVEIQFLHGFLKVFPIGLALCIDKRLEGALLDFYLGIL
jgi:hypothetical protein